jgi:outer membrane lipoprotein LolB
VVTAAGTARPAGHRTCRAELARLQSPIQGRIAKAIRPLQALVLPALLVLVAGCASAPRMDPGQWRALAPGDDPARMAAFRVAGRLAVSDGRDGGSAGFLWIQDGDRFEVELRQPVSQRTWRLSGDGRGALLEGDPAGPRRADSAEQLLAQALGWNVPVRALARWVRGLPDDGPVASSEFDGEARLTRLDQAGWQVDYRGWHETGAWPTRIQARQPPYSVRLTIQDWAVRR